MGIVWDSESLASHDHRRCVVDTNFFPSYGFTQRLRVEQFDGKIIVPTRCLHPDHGSYEYIKFCDKKERRLLIESKLFISWPKVCKREAEGSESEIWRCYTGAWRWEVHEPVNIGKAGKCEETERLFPKASARNAAQPHLDDSPWL